MTQTDKKYHHGDLREALLCAATDLIRTQGLEALSMRKLADQVGVSRMAPYHHFKDKNALLCAIAEAGFQQQDAAVCTLMEQHADLKHPELFEQYVLAYIHFAHSHAETYDLMYGRDIWKAGEPTESLKQISKQSFRHWVNWIETLQDAGLFSQDEPALRIAQSTWAALHGLCRLFNDGVYVDTTDLNSIARTTVNLLLRAR